MPWSFRACRVRAFFWAVAYLASAGLALHLVLPQLPVLRRSLGLAPGSSGPLLVAAFVAILASFLCYGELLGRSAGAAAGFGASIKRRQAPRASGASSPCA